MVKKVKVKQKAKTKLEELSELSNRLAELLNKSFENYKGRSTSQLLVAY